jgi:hypothetical protein
MHLQGPALVLVWMLVQMLVLLLLVVSTLQFP